MYFVHVLWNKYFGNFHVLMLFASNEYHSLIFAVWCVCVVFLEMFLYSSWFVSSCMYLLQRETCFFCLVHVSRCSFFLYHHHFLSALYLFGGGDYKAYVMNMLCTHARLFICLQQLTSFCEILFEFSAHAYGDIQILHEILLIKTGGYIPSL